MKTKSALICLVCLSILSCTNVSKRTLCAVAPCTASVKGMVPGTGTVSHPKLVEKDGSSPDYVLGAEDVIEVSVWKNEALSKVVTVRPDGKISLPLVGDVQAAGLSAAELKEAITEKLLQYKETPEVSVIVQQVNSYSVYITGEVAKPGKFSLKSQATLLQGITLAGGFTQYASKNDIVLLRRNESGQLRIRVRYDDILSGKKGAEDLPLLPGDTVVVP